MKFSQLMKVTFLIVGLLTVLEFIFVRGMFTWLIAVGATTVVGLINVGINLKMKEWSQALLFLLSTVALCMGYFIIIQ